jgi:sensor histidine kinase YesM
MQINPHFLFNTLDTINMNFPQTGKHLDNITSI